MDDEMKELNAYFERVEGILKSGEAPEKTTREMRDALMFYTAAQVRKTNGGMRENRNQIRMLWWAIAILAAISAAAHGIPLLPLP